MNGYRNEYEKGVYDKGFAEGRICEFERIKQKIERYVNDPDKSEIVIDFIREEITDDEELDMELLSLITPVVSMDYIIKNNCSYVANDFMTDDYVYYWSGDLETGKEVKVKAIDIARYEYNRMYLETEEALNGPSILGVLSSLYEQVKAVKTHDLGENLVKTEILQIIKGERK